MQENLSFIKKTISFLESHDLIVSLDAVDPFYDEPKMIQYSISLTNAPLKDTQDKVNTQIHGLGYSFSNKYLALAKCLGEALERLCLYTLESKRIQSLPLSVSQFDISAYGKKIPEKQTLGMIKGTNILTNKECFIPSQLAYVEYLTTYHEPMLTEPNTSGGAGGNSLTRVLLSGIYELIERDAFMTAYLAKIPLQKIDLHRIRWQKIQTILHVCQKYKLDIFSFTTTNDLEVPSYMTFVIDNTGMGPALSVGLRAGLNTKDALLGSIEEAFLGRRWIRKLWLTNKSNTFVLKPNQITNLDNRGLYWSSPRMLKYVQYLLDGKSHPLRSSHFRLTEKEELDYIKKIFRKKKIDIFSVDITHTIMKKLPFFVHKVIIPKLQPLYLNEKNKEVRHDRLRAASDLLGHKEYHINKIPHPFL